MAEYDGPVSFGGDILDFGGGAAALTPSYLRRSGADIGNMQMELLRSILGNSGFDITQAANTARANVASTASQAANQIAGNARFRGSGVGAALQQAALQTGASQEANILNQAEAAQFNRKAGAANLAHGLVTMPLLQSLGLGSNFLLGQRGLDIQESMIPSNADKILGAFSGALTGYLGGLG